MSDTKDPTSVPSEDRVVIWTGWLKRGPTAGTVVGELKDSWGWPIEIEGELDKEAGGYILRGRTGAVPDALKVPIVDSPVTKDG